MSVDAEVVARTLAPDGVFRIPRARGSVQIAVTIRNEGERNSGRAKVDVTVPSIVDTSGVHWSDASGRALAAFPGHARRASVGGQLTRMFDALVVGVDQVVYFSMPVEVSRDDVTTHLLHVHIAAEGADKEAEFEYPLRVTRSPRA